MPVVRLGNQAALDAGQPLEGDQVTTVHLPDSWSTEQVFNGITDPQGVWRAHSGASAPAWVESDDPDVAQMISEHYACPVGRPEES